VFRGYWVGFPEKTKSEFRDDGFFITAISARSTTCYVHIRGRVHGLLDPTAASTLPEEI